MMSTLSAYLPSLGLRPRHTCKHSLSSSNGTAGKLYMKSSHAYHVEVSLEGLSETASML